VSMSNIHLEELPEPSRTKSRILYTGAVAVALVAALYVYRMQPMRGVATAAAHAAPGFESPIAGVFRNAPPVADIPVKRSAPTEGVVSVDDLRYAPPTEPARSDKSSGRTRAKDKASDKEKDQPAQTDPAQPAATRPQTIEDAVMGRDHKPAAPAKDDPTASPAQPVEPEPPAESVHEFSPSQAQAALSSAAGAAASCLSPGDPSATVRVAVTFAPSGSATRSLVEGPPFAGTPQGGCIARLFRGAHVNAYNGGLITVRKTFQIR